MLERGENPYGRMNADMGSLETSAKRKSEDERKEKNRKEFLTPVFPYKSDGVLVVTFRG